jgi:hypothetical protein
MKIDLSVHVLDLVQVVTMDMDHMVIQVLVVVEVPVLNTQNHDECDKLHHPDLTTNKINFDSVVFSFCVGWS